MANNAKRKASLIGVLSIGTTLEWAEYTFYGYMALTLSSLFFPSDSAQIGILKTFGIFAVGYIMRPLGALIFGYIGDQYGRKPALMGSIFLMGIATLCIGLLPTYSQIGTWAAGLLLVLRMLQGLAVAGEYNGAGIFAIENAQKYPALAGSWIGASAALGMVIGGLGAFLISLTTLSYAWRIPFLMGGLSCLLSFWLRRNTLAEQPVTTRQKMPILAIFNHHKRGFLTVCAIAAFTGIYVYIGNIYIVVFLKNIANLPTQHATLFAIWGEIIVMIFIPIMGYLSDKYDVYKQYRMGLIGVALCSPFIFQMSATGHYGLIMIAMALYGVLNGIVCGPMFKILFDQFPHHLRYTGISFAWSLSAAIFSGTAPAMAQFLTNYLNWALAPSLYLSCIALITYIVMSYKSQNKRIEVDKLNTIDLTY